VLVAGATPSALNGEKRVISADTYTITYDASGIADQTATGTIECRTAPVGGWEKTYSATQKGAYRSVDLDATGLYLRVDDTGTRVAYTRGYESMSDVDTGLAPFPTVAQSATGGGWTKSITEDTVSKPWGFAGDSRMLYLFVDWTGTAIKNLHWFGDINSLKPGDAYHCVSSMSGNSFINANISASSNRNLDGTSNAFVARPYTQLEGAQVSGLFGSRVTAQMGKGGSNAYPSPVNAGLLFTGDILVEEGGIIRGTMPGLLNVLNDRPAISNDTIVTTSDNRLILLQIINESGVAAIDITGPWR